MIYHILSGSPFFIFRIHRICLFNIVYLVRFYLNCVWIDHTHELETLSFSYFEFHRLIVPNRYPHIVLKDNIIKGRLFLRYA